MRYRNREKTDAKQNFPRLRCSVMSDVQRRNQRAQLANSGVLAGWRRQGRPELNTFC